MFHNSTTLHHSHSFYTGSQRESRLVHAGGGPNIVARTQLRSAVIWDYMKPLRRMARIYSWAFGWPIFVKAFDYTMKGLRAAGDGIEWGAYAGKEAALGTAQMTVAPMAMLAKSRLTMIMRMLWHVPIATASACIRTPIAMALSPFRLISGVRDAIKSVPKNAGEILSSAYNLNVWDTLNNVRKAVTDVLVPPISKPLIPMLAPAGHLVNTALGAELQTVAVARQAITDTIPQGFNRIRNAPATASAWLDEQRAIAAAKKAQLEAEKQARKEALAAKVAEDKGEAVPKAAGGGAKH